MDSDPTDRYTRPLPNAAEECRAACGALVVTVSGRGKAGEGGDLRSRVWHGHETYHNENSATRRSRLGLATAGLRPRVDNGQIPHRVILCVAGNHGEFVVLGGGGEQSIDNRKCDALQLRFASHRSPELGDLCIEG